MVALSVFSESMDGPIFSQYLIRSCVTLNVKRGCWWKIQKRERVRVSERERARKRERESVYVWEGELIKCARISFFDATPENGYDRGCTKREISIFKVTRKSKRFCSFWTKVALTFLKIYLLETNFKKLFFIVGGIFSYYLAFLVRSERIRVDISFLPYQYLRWTRKVGASFYLLFQSDVVFTCIILIFDVSRLPGNRSRQSNFNPASRRAFGT